MTANPAPPVLRGLRRLAVIVVIVAVSISAVLGIVLLLTGGWGDLQGRILLTTIVIAAFATTALCHLAQVNRPLRVVGFTGIAASVGALIPVLWIIWGDWGVWGVFGSVGYDWLWKSFAVLGILAASLAQANLLLLLASRRQRAVRLVLCVTLAAIAGVALMIWLPVLTDGEVPGDFGDSYWRIFGVVAILDVLGTIVLPVLGLVLKDSRAGLATFTAHIPADLIARIDATAASRGATRDAVVVAALERGLDPTDP